MKKNGKILNRVKILLSMFLMFFLFTAASAEFTLKDIRYDLKQKGFVGKTKTTIDTTGTVALQGSKKEIKVHSHIVLMTSRKVVGVTQKDGMKVAEIENTFEDVSGTIYAGEKKLDVDFKSLVGKKYTVIINEKGKVLERKGLENIELSKDLDVHLLSGIESEIFAHPEFPKRELGIPDSWIQKVIVPGLEGKPVELRGIYYVKGFEKVSGEDCLVIKMYTIHPLQSTVFTNGMKVMSRGVSEKFSNIYFSKETQNVIYSKWQDKVELTQTAVYKDKGKTKQLTTEANLTVNATTDFHP